MQVRLVIGWVTYQGEVIALDRMGYAAPGLEG